ncbi:ral guanine nucleotide dissociation stimulator-like 1 isoform X1 [Synchiropus splendidus]|uniref:ral guanine nucleotide dissociation stimulator-like 1 isoform X1 n=1 Tax=Synchiropus splendidus TaxID=270530 RepID=UPI00237D941A|nr:ral guanine nucleotide dissociation stimulator-like 1 isoform X1 [Synchiropus splendidus]
MKTVLPVCGGDSYGFRSRMKKLLWHRPSHLVDLNMDAETGVWLRSFQLLDTDGQCEDPVQEWGEEEEDGAVFGVTLRREPALKSPDTTDHTMTTGFVQYHTVKLRRMKAGTLERLITHLLNHEHREPDYIPVFLSTYRAFTTASTLIELLFQRDDTMTNLDNTVSTHSVLPPIIKLWLEEYSADFHEPPQYQALRLLCAHLRLRLHFRCLAQMAESLLKRLQEQDCCKPATVSSCPEEERVHQLMDFPERLVAEQLTRLDVELFVRMVPSHCLGCIWSQRDKKEKANLAPTVRATISQFNSVTSCVISSLLCPLGSPTPNSSPTSSTNFWFPSSAPSSPRSLPTSPAHRARLIERWIGIAQECRLLKNFSSLRAILSALQSNAVFRLKKTWAAVNMERMTAFNHLCETFPDVNCVLTSKEILMENESQTEGSLSSSGSKSPDFCAKQSYSGGAVPYLGTYLTVLTMLDTALTDTLEGGLINFEKRRKEFEILSHIRLLQASCFHYNIPVNNKVTKWLQGHPPLSDQQSDKLSRNLEPPVDLCPWSPNSWSSRLHAKKMSSLQKMTHLDQISLSSGSSSSDMEDASSPSPLKLNQKCLSGSLHNVSEDYPSMCSSSRLSSSSCSSSNPDLSSTSLSLPPESPPPYSSACSSPQVPLPVYNKQIADSCIIRVSVECVSNGSVYKSILLTSQDHTPQVVRRALDKHYLEDVSCRNYKLCQMLTNGKELLIPENANVFYGMCTRANYDFVLRPQQGTAGRHLDSSGVQSRCRQFC